MIDAFIQRSYSAYDVGQIKELMSISRKISFHFGGDDLRNISSEIAKDVNKDMNTGINGAMMKVNRKIDDFVEKGSAIMYGISPDTVDAKNTALKQLFYGFSKRAKNWLDKFLDNRDKKHESKQSALRNEWKKITGFSYPVINDTPYTRRFDYFEAREVLRDRKHPQLDIEGVVSKNQNNSVIDIGYKETGPRIDMDGIFEKYDKEQSARENKKFVHEKCEVSAER